MSSFAYTDPGEIDGEPQEVRDETLELLDRLSRLVEGISESARRQLLNAGMTEAIEHGGGHDPLGVYAVRRPKEHRLIEQLDDRGRQYAHYVRVLRKAVAEYDADPDASVLP